MKKIKLYIIIVLFAGVSSASFSQTKDANAILENTIKKYNEYQNGMEISFVTNINSPKNNISESFEGKLIIKGDKFILSTPDISSWFNGTTLWSYMQGTQEVNVSNPTGSDLRSINPLLILKNYKKDFNVSCVGESTSHNSKISNDITMIPKKKEDIERLELQVEKASSLPVKIVMIMKNDLRNTITIKSINSLNMTDNDFTFPEKEYPDAEIIDLR